MSAVHLLVPGDPATRTGGYLYDRRIVAELEALGRTVALHRLSDRFPRPDEAALGQAGAVLAGLPDGAVAIVDGLAFGAMPEVARGHADRLRLVALVHHPLAAETGLDADAAARLFASERAALAAARRVIVTSRSTLHALGRYDVAPDRIGVVVPGTDPAPLARGSGGTVPTLLCVATLTPRKGHAVLIAALGRLADQPWRLRLAGSAERDPATALAVRRQIAEAGLEGRVELLGEVDRPALDRLYAAADLFVLPSWFEGYGMALAEALARGLPVVATGAGAIPETVPAEAGLLVPPGDDAALAAALRRVLEDDALHARLRAGAAAARRRLPSWRDAGRRFLAEIATVERDGAGRHG